MSQLSLRTSANCTLHGRDMMQAHIYNTAVYPTNLTRFQVCINWYYVLFYLHLSSFSPITGSKYEHQDTLHVYIHLHTQTLFYPTSHIILHSSHFTGWLAVQCSTLFQFPVRWGSDVLRVIMGLYTPQLKNMLDVFSFGSHTNITSRWRIVHCMPKFCRVLWVKQADSSQTKQCLWWKGIFCERSVVCVVVPIEVRFQGCNTVQYGEWVPIFHRKLLPPSYATQHHITENINSVPFCFLFQNIFWNPLCTLLGYGLHHQTVV